MSSPNETSTSSVKPARHREVTFSAVFFGIVIGVIMNASFTYAVLKIGFGIGGSTIAAILGFGFLRGILRKGTILETNITQTVASAVNTTFSGVVFTVPVLYLLDLKGEYLDLSITSTDFWMLTAACVIGALLGGVFIVPLRKQMIEIDRLRFPTGTAVAEILKSPGAGAQKAVVLCMGVLIGAVVYLPAALPNIKVTVPDEERVAEMKKTTMEIRIAAEQSLRERGVTINTWAPLKTDAELLAEVKKMPPERVPIWKGYESFGWSVAAPDAPSKEDRKGTAKYKKELIENDLDRDRDGKPDLIMDNDHGINLGRWLGLPPEILLLFAISPLSLAAGYITGRAGLMVLAGGILAFFVINPVAYNYLDLMPAATFPHGVPSAGRGLFNRPLGIGMLLGGAMMGVLFSLPAMKAVFKGLASARNKQGDSDELGLGFLAIAVVIGIAGLLGVNMAIGQGEQGWLGGLPPFLNSFILALIGGAWIWFSGIIIAQCTGMTDWSPISGISLLTVVLMLLLGGADNVLGAVMFGAALCVSVSGAADMIQDLKTGHLVGAIPKKQQRIELTVMGIGPVVALCVLLVIVELNKKTTREEAEKAVAKQTDLSEEEREKAIKDGTIPIGPGTPTTAPQAQALEAVIKGVSGGEFKLSPSDKLREKGEDEEVEPAMPYALYGCGATVGCLLGLGGFPGLGVLVGLSMYLPIHYILTYGVGCVIYMLLSRFKGKSWAEGWGVPLCAGMIVGEALTILVISIITLAQGVNWS